MNYCVTFQKRAGLMKIIISLTILFFLLSGCDRSSSSSSFDLVLYDFESDTELNSLNWKCHSLYFISSDFAARGSKSLKMELYPADYPGFFTTLAIKKWINFTEFSFDVFNPEDRPVRLWVRIDDQSDYPDFEDRYNESFQLSQGKHHVEIPLSRMVTSGLKRRLNLNNIIRLCIFLDHPRGKTVLYIDNIALSKKDTK